MKNITISVKKCLIQFCTLLLSSFAFSQTTYTEISVNWPEWSSENRVDVYNPSGTLLTRIDNGYDGCCDNNYSTTVSLGCIPDGTNYYIIMYDSYGDSWNGGGSNVTVTTAGTTELTNNGAGTNTSGTTVYFDVNGGCFGSCSSMINTFPYNEGFEGGNTGAWVQDTSDDRNWTNRTGGTPSDNTGPSSANGGSRYLYTEATSNFNRTFNLISPCFDITSATSAQFSFYYHMYGGDMGSLYVDLSTNGGLSYDYLLWSQTGQVQTSNGQAWNLVNIDLSSYVGQTIIIRFRGVTGGDYRSDMAIDDISLNISTTPQPEINLVGNGNTINNSDTTPTTTDDTDFGTINEGATRTHTFTIQNLGSSTLNIGTITSSNSNFIITSTPSATIASGASSNFSVQYAPSTSGTVTSVIQIANNDSNENPYTFTVQGNANPLPPMYTAYYENFDSNNGGWTNTTSTNDSWVWTNGFGTANEMGEGSFWRNTNYNNYSNNTNIVVQSPVLNFTGLKDLKLSIDIKYNTQSNTDGMRILYSVNGNPFVLLGSSGSGTKWYGGNVSALSSDGWSGDGHSADPTFNPHSQFERSSITLPNGTFSNVSNVRFRVQFRSDNSTNQDGVAFDNVLIEANPITALSGATVAPANLTGNLRLWLKTNTGISVTDGSKLTNWEDQAYDTSLDKEDAYASNTLAPTYRDNINRNMNYNPVADFDHDNIEYMNGKGGYFAQDYFAVFRSDDEVDTNTGSYSPGREFVIGGRFSDEAYHEDATGLAMGSSTARYNNEVLAHNISSFPNASNAGPNDTSYGRAFTSTSTTYRNHPIIVNVKTNASGTLSEIYKNGKRIDNTTGQAGNGTNLNFNEFNNLQFLIGTGRSGITGRTTSQMNGMITEIISYTSPNSAINQQKIQSYLAVKYGVTLQDASSGLADHRLNDVDYIDSQGSIIWDTSDNVGHNYDVAGIGRDDASLLDQRQSRSQNDEADGLGPTSGFLTMALTDTYNTNKENIANTTTLNDREFLMWGNNNADINGEPTVVNVDMSANIGDPSLQTIVTFTAIPRIWKVKEHGGDIPKVEVSIPVSAVRTANPPDGKYLMFISQNGIFDPSADYRVMTESGGYLYADYDFDGTEYITFGWAPEREFIRSIYFNGSTDYVDMEDALDLNPTGFTISAWVNANTNSNNTSILSKRNAAYTEGYDFKITSTGKFQVSWKRASGSMQSITSNTTIPKNQWHQLAVIYNGTRAFLYIDGILDNEANLSAPEDTNQSFYIAAADKNTPQAFFHGNIDEVRVWNTTLTLDQLHYIMNQEIEENSTFVGGSYFVNRSITPTKNDIATLPWSDLAGYYPMSIYTYTNTKDESGNGHQGALRNLKTVDKQTAPLPYISAASGGSWDADATWENGNMQTKPGANSIVDNTITVDWNIVETNHNITMDNSGLATGNAGNRNLLALFVDSNELTVDGDNTTENGYGVTISHYLNLDGKIDLEGESQLIQTLDSDLVVGTSGSLEKDQQGTQDFYTYNYWSSPVGTGTSASNNYSYSLNNNILKDGTTPATPSNITFVSGYNGATSPSLSIAHYWIWKFGNLPSGDYSSWQHVRNTGTILAGEGFTMKGVTDTGGTVSLEQNYVFDGKPNNGDVNLTINAGNDYLVGNPYASAIDAEQFIIDNGARLDYTDPSGSGTYPEIDPSISGTLYFWEHWGGGSHVTAEYQGGYGTYNFSGGVPAAAYGTPDPDVAQVGTGTKTPGRYIPVGQGFFVTSDNSGTINFNNGQRVFQKEGTAASVFMRNSNSASTTENNTEIVDERMKLRIGFNSVNTIHRQLLVTVDDRATAGEDWGFDAEITDDKEYQIDDMAWLIEDKKYTVQGINEINQATILPLEIHTSTDGMNNITIDILENVPNDLNIYAHDKELNIYHDLRESNYEIFLLAGEYLDRFEITFHDDNLLSVDENEIADTLQVFYANSKESIVIQNPKLVDLKSVEVFNILGQSIYTFDDLETANHLELKTNKISTGTYILHLKTNDDNTTITKKVLVK
ncbi:LamG-like jellyroll fold domain-containing protein [Corallibacter sp.]|uniref:LamG-like jellyroll fold domain-containing protein n=1 Tax=Corallibacter sp. TaxID=2038084 RepID=UPI003A92EE9C